MTTSCNNKLSTLELHLFNHDDAMLTAFRGRVWSIIIGVVSAGAVATTLYFAPHLWILPIHLGAKEFIFVTFASGFTTLLPGVIGFSIYSQVKNHQISFRKFREALEDGVDILRSSAVIQSIYDNNNETVYNFAQFLITICYKYENELELTEEEKGELKDPKKIKVRDNKIKRIKAENNAIQNLVFSPTLPDILNEVEKSGVKLHQVFVNKCKTVIETYIDKNATGQTVQRTTHIKNTLEKMV